MAIATKVVQSYIDKSREGSRSTFYLPPVSAGGADYDTITGDGPTDAYGAMKVALAAVTTCNMNRGNVICESYSDLPSTPTASEARRETKLWIQYADNVNNRLHEMEIPGPDVSLFDQVNTDEVDIAANAAFVTFRTVFEAQCVSPDGNPITVTRARLNGAFL